MDPMALDTDGERVVDSLDQIIWERHHDGQQVVRQPAPPVVVQQANGWATVLLTLQDRRAGAWGPRRWVITRWKRDRGAWRLYDKFRLSEAALRGLVVQGATVLAGARKDPDDGTTENSQGPEQGLADSPA